MAGSTLSSLVVDSDSSRRTRLGNTVHLAAQHDSSKVDCDSERIWRMMEKYTPKDRSQKRPESGNIFDNLYNCYIDHQYYSDKRFRSAVNLLEKLPVESAKVTLVVSLYSDEEGYSLRLCPQGTASQLKEIYLPYERQFSRALTGTGHGRC